MKTSLLEDETSSALQTKKSNDEVEDELHFPSRNKGFTFTYPYQAATLIALTCSALHYPLSIKLPIRCNQLGNSKKKMKLAATFVLMAGLCHSCLMIFLPSAQGGWHMHCLPSFFSNASCREAVQPSHRGRKLPREELTAQVPGHPGCRLTPV